MKLLGFEEAYCSILLKTGKQISNVIRLQFLYWNILFVIFSVLHSCSFSSHFPESTSKADVLNPISLWVSFIDLIFCEVVLSLTFALSAKRFLVFSPIISCSLFVISSRAFFTQLFLYWEPWSHYRFLCSPGLSHSAKHPMVQRAFQMIKCYFHIYLISSLRL